MERYTTGRVIEDITFSKVPPPQNSFDNSQTHPHGQVLDGAVGAGASEDERDAITSIRPRGTTHTCENGNSGDDAGQQPFVNDRRILVLKDDDTRLSTTLQNNYRCLGQSQSSGYQSAQKTARPLPFHESSFTTGPPIASTNRQLPTRQYPDAYSSTGFDMIEILFRVATRPQPQINIGNVDMSCAFIVCDSTQQDMPIVYCSEEFERLTGYNQYEILGRNCRFLQSPDGNVKAGMERNHVVKKSAVSYLQTITHGCKEGQTGIVNYRKGGQAFLNLVTVIPISLDNSNEVRYFVGLQADIGETPG